MSKVPTDTVTFLCTSIEESPAGWEEHPEAMPAVVADYDVLLRSVFIVDGRAQR